MVVDRSPREVCSTPHNQDRQLEFGPGGKADVVRGTQTRMYGEAGGAEPRGPAIPIRRNEIC